MNIEFTCVSLMSNKLTLTVTVALSLTGEPHRGYRTAATQRNDRSGPHPSHALTPLTTQYIFHVHQHARWPIPSS